MLAAILLLLSVAAQAYPIDGYEHTGIRRLDHAQQVLSGTLPGRKLHPGQYLPLAEVQPRWRASNGHELPPVDAEFSRRIAALVPAAQRGKYAIAVLDLSDPRQPRYAAHNAQLRENVGSVNKILVALALLQKLADLYPNDTAGRERVLRETRIVADGFSQYDHHKVTFWDPAAKRRVFRTIRAGDEANLWEFLDWMLSASSNSAAAMVQKELIALSHFGARYPVPADEHAAFFKDTPRQELTRLMAEAMGAALTRNGFDPENIHQGSFFTSGGKRRVDGSGRSYATPEQLLKYLYRLEAGTLIDAWSSRELKRLMYMTQRRIRYASHPALNGAAVYFKSGSYYQCHTRGACGKYKGDKTNRLASVAIVEFLRLNPQSGLGADPAVEGARLNPQSGLGADPAAVGGAATPALESRQRYLVAVTSNVLRVNSAVAHQTLAMRIHRLIEKDHPAAEAPQPIPESAYPIVPVDDPEAHQPGPDQ